MARRTLEVTIPAPTAGAENRDAGKTFVITEMPADQAERWATRALLLLVAAGVDLPANAATAGLAGFAAAGADSLEKIDYKFYDAAEPLLTEMFTCVKYQPEGAGILPMSILPGAASQIEEVSTRFQLRKAVIQLHVNFSTAANK